MSIKEFLIIFIEIGGKKWEFWYGCGTRSLEFLIQLFKKSFLILILFLFKRQNFKTQKTTLRLRRATNNCPSIQSNCQLQSHQTKQSKCKTEVFRLICNHNVASNSENHNWSLKFNAFFILIRIFFGTEFHQLMLTSNNDQYFCFENFSQSEKETEFLIQ
jgi:hypothetical protein